MSKGKISKWKKEYSQFGFTTTTVDGVQRAQCILRDVAFCNSNLKPSKLSQHFKKKHGGIEAGYNAETLKNKTSSLRPKWYASKNGIYYC